MQTLPSPTITFRERRDCPGIAVCYEVATVRCGRALLPRVYACRDMALADALSRAGVAGLSVVMLADGEAA